MKWKIRKYLLSFFIGVLALYLAINTVRAFINPVQPIKIVKPNEQIADNEYIISQDAIMSKLRSKSQIVSLEQSLHKKDIYVDENWAGKRSTEMVVDGKFKLGLETKDIEIKHIDNVNQIVCIKLGKPVLISLDLPFNKIDFSKTSGWLRLSMNEDEQKKFYSAARKNLEKEIMNDKELMKVADRMNRDTIMGLLQMLPEIKSVVFE